jgi:hypothetical protein
MIVLADETLETFFDHEFANSFKLTEKATEQQRSLGREIFDNLLATGSKLAASTVVSVRPSNGLKSKSSSSISSSELQATIDAIEETKLEEKAKLEAELESQQEKKAAIEAKPEKIAIITQPEPKSAVADKHVLGDSDDDDEEEEGEEDLSPDVLEEVDRLLKEYGDEDD